MLIKLKESKPDFRQARDEQAKHFVFGVLEFLGSEAFKS